MAKVLIIDDDPDIRFLAIKILRKEGHTIVEADSGIEGWEKIREEKPDLILLDIMMPGEDGWEICRKLKGSDATRDIPVIMFTVRASNLSVERSLDYAHADAQINKPFRIAEFIKTIDKVLGKKG